MKAAIFKGPGAVEAGERPDPVIQQPTDAIVRVALGCVCGSDLWYYRGESQHAVGSIGHEFIGIVEQAGAEVRGVRVGDLVIAPFIYSDMSCPHCLNGSTASCVAGGNFGNGTIDGGQGEAVRVPLAGSTLVPVPGSGHPDAVLRSLLALSGRTRRSHQPRPGLRLRDRPRPHRRRLPGHGRAAGHQVAGPGRDSLTAPANTTSGKVNAMAISEIAPAATEGQA
jgi:threonine dehydrogenase-like Zn-dependent dehydrogenase